MSNRYIRIRTYLDGSSKIRYKFGSFVVTGANTIKPKDILCSEGVIFSLNHIHHAFLTNLEHKYLEKDLKINGSIFCRTILQIKNNLFN
jgi:hypothetical protein